MQVRGEIKIYKLWKIERAQTPNQGNNNHSYHLHIGSKSSLLSICLILIKIKKYQNTSSLYFLRKICFLSSWIGLLSEGFFLSNWLMKLIAYFDVFLGNVSLFEYCNILNMYIGYSKEGFFPTKMIEWKLSCDHFIRNHT